MENKTETNLFSGRICSLALCFYVLTLLPMAAFIVISGGGTGFAKWLFTGTTLLAYTALYLLPAFLCLALACCLKSPRVRQCLVWLSAFLAASIWLVLSLDIQLLRQFGFHINGMVLNLLMTRGGFESMGLGLSTLLPAVIGIVVVYCLYGLLVRLCGRQTWAERLGRALLLRRHGWKVLAVGTVCLLISLFSTGVADFYSNVNVLTNLETFPAVVTLRMRSFMRSIGCREPSREEIMLAAGKNSNVNYPARPIVRDEGRRRYNIIMLVCESMRKDLLTDEAMPETWKFAQDAIRFENHYSGGNGTRVAMFSLIYGLYGLNWDNFLNNKRPPVLFDWLHEDNCQFLCQTSAKFSYPEFDKTIFSSMKQTELIEQKGDGPNGKDVALVDAMLDFIRNRDTSRPFFAFGFFESTHAPYTFPEDKAVRQDYRTSINYNTVTEKDAASLYARYVNAAHFVDEQLARVYALLADDPELAANTIVVLTGDHGEEFFENGRLGHNSTFSDQQTMPLFLLKIPGVEPRVVNHITQHTDLIATLAPFLGVRNPPEDFCVGQDMLSDRYDRDHYLLCGWNIAVYLDEQYKTVLPLGAKGGIMPRNMTRRDDTPCTEGEEDGFLSKHAPQILKIQQDLSRFIAR